MTPTEQFRQNAEECRAMARIVGDPDKRQALYGLAQWWDQRADQLEERLRQVRRDTDANHDALEG